MPTEDEEIQRALEVEMSEEKPVLLERPEVPPPPPDLESKAEIVPSGNTPYEMMDRKDEEQILHELEGAPHPVLEEMVYSFSGSQGMVTGLSWIGVKTLAVEAGHYSIDDVKIQDNEHSYRVLAKARDINRNVTMFGVAEQQKNMKTREGREIADSFALQKAVSKAQRNALIGLLPRTLVAEFIKRCIEVKKERMGPRVRRA